MSARKGSAGVTADTLAEAAAKLPVPELERLVDRLLELRARRVAPVLSHEESELLRTINQGLPTDKQMRFDKLVKKRRASRLTEGEREELLRLVDEIENLDAARAEALGKLAALRGVPLSELMHKLGIKPRPVL